MYEGTSHECIVEDLLPYTEYIIHVVAVTDLDRSPPSESTSIITGESGLFASVIVVIRFGDLSRNSLK